MGLVALLTAVLAFTTDVYAGTFKLPLHANNEGLANHLARRDANTQAPLKSMSLKPDGTAQEKIKSFRALFHKTTISIGNPPQHFHVALDVNTGDLFVPSATCKYDICDVRQENNPYNSSLSSTYVANGCRASTDWADVNYEGFFSQDTLRIGGLDLTDYTFEEWTSASCRTIGCINGGYDGVLGLAPPWDIDNAGGERSVLSTMIARDLLDSPVFSLKLPLYEHGEGELLIGATNPELNSSDFVSLQALNQTADNQSIVTWTVPASHIVFDTPVPLEVNLSNETIAGFDIAVPYIMVPAELERNLTAAIGAKPGPYWFNNVPCERRQELPDLTFTLGGQNFTISAFHYILEVEWPGIPPQVGNIICISTFMPVEEFGIPHDTIVLGHPFLRGFYSKWDFGKREIGLAGLA